MNLLVWDDTNKRWVRARAAGDGTLYTKPEGVYLEDDPTLIDEEQHRLRLTVDAKLLTYDPATFDLVTDVHDDLEVVDGNVDTLLDRLTAARAGYLNQLDFNLQEKLNEIDAEVEGLGGAAMRGTDLAQTEINAAARYAVILADVDEIEGLLKNATYGLAALETLVDELEPRLVTGLEPDLTLREHLYSGNFIPNPGFELGDLTYWTTPGAGSASAQGVTVKFGSWACQMIPDIAGTLYLRSSGFKRCYPGRRMRLSVYLEADVNITVSTINIMWYDKGNAFISRSSSPDYGGNYAWAFRKMVATAPDEAWNYKVEVKGTSGGVAGNLYVDAIHVPTAPMDAELHEAAVHVSDIFPDDTSKTVTVTSGGAAHAWGAWANLVDSVAGLLSTAFAADDGYLAAIHIEDCNSTDNLYMLELRDNVTGETLCRTRFSKVLNKIDVGHQTRIRSIRIPTGADIEYRMKDATGGKTAELHVRYYLV